ncbi:MAG: M1 family aminopeptidase [Gemmatimonadota bacterium]|nr:MAG: M1 family aminopeptidase [Gemmatimonadota bacterium]
MAKVILQARSLLVVASFALTACGESPSVSPTDLGVPWELAELRSATITDVRYSYRLTVPRPESEPLTGSVEVRFTWADPEGRDVVLDFTNPTSRVRSVSVNGEVVEWEPVNDHIVVSAEGLEAGGENSVVVHFIAGEDALNRNPDFLYTLFVPDRAHFSIPIFDQPNLKARFALALDVPSAWRAVANGAVVRQVVGGGAQGEEGRTVYTFAETALIPPYLFAFAVGEFQVETAQRGGRTMRMYHRETDREKVDRNRDVIFDLHQTAIDWLEEYTGIPYPFGKFDFVLIPPFQYGGMEHPGSIFYRQASLMLDESATQEQYLGRANLIAHETAHQWFGDLVTMNWFDDVWMKEVFADFMAAKIVHPSFPRLNHDLRFFLAHHNAAYGVDRTAGANPIRQPLENLREAGTLYGAIIYQKAPIVMRQLERLVGETVFRKGLREYLNAFAFGNATWPQLIKILDRLSTEDLPVWSSVWVEEPGRPSVSAAVVDDGTGRMRAVGVFQEDLAGRDRVWPQQLEVILAYDDSIARVPVRLMIEGAAMDDWIGRLRPNFILPNGSGVEYGHFHLDDVSKSYLLEHLPELTDPLLRGIVVGTLWDAVLEGEIAPQRWLDLLLATLDTETDEQNVGRILAHLRTTYWRLIPDAERDRRAADIEAVLWQRLVGASNATLKSSLFSTWRTVVLTELGVGRLREIWAQAESVPGVRFSENDYTSMASDLALRGVPDAEAILDEQFRRITNPDRRARFEFVRPALSEDPAVREAFFASLADPANRAREPWVLSGLGFLHHRLRAAHSQRFILPTLEMVEEIQRTGDIFFPKRWLDTTLGGHNSRGTAQIVTDFLEARPDYPPRLRAKILQSADMLYRSAGILESTKNSEESNGGG